MNDTAMDRPDDEEVPSGTQRRPRWFVLLGGLAAVGLAVGLGVWWMLRSDARTDETRPSPCADSAELIAALEADPGLTAFAGDLGVEGVRCASGWAGATVTTRTGDLFAVFESSEDGWQLIASGVNDPCATIALPDGVEAEIGC
jgi:hypothetical protein